MDCYFCHAAPDVLKQCVVKQDSDVDTSVFEYKWVCGDCVTARGLQKAVIGESPRDELQ
jgi:hypothetical protein